jgi:homoserine dehydrogenase
VLAQVAAVLGRHGVSIATMQQAPRPDVVPPAVPGEPAAPPALAHLIITTHTATDAALAATVEAIAGLESVTRVVSVLRVEGA